MKSGVAEWDLVVAGAGPAGCALAAKVASAGARVLVLEQAKSPGEGRGWIVDVERTAFAAAGVPEPGPDALWPAPGRQVMVSSDRASTIDLQRLPVVPVRNDLYVGQLARWAESAGAVMRTGCTAVEPLIGAGAVTGVRFLDGDAEEVARSHVAADCTGMSGVLRRKTPAGWGLDRAVKQSDIVIARREVWSIDRDAARAAAADACSTNCRLYAYRPNATTNSNSTTTTGVRITSSNEFDPRSGSAAHRRPRLAFTAPPRTPRRAPKPAPRRRRIRKE